MFEALRARADASQAELGARLAREGVRSGRTTSSTCSRSKPTRERRPPSPASRGSSPSRPNRPAALQRVREAAPGFAPRAAPAIEPNVALVGAPGSGSRGLTGQGIVIGVADTGVDWDHPALLPHIAAGTERRAHAYNWHDAVHDADPVNAVRLELAGALRRSGPRHSVAGHAVGDDGGENRIGVAPGARWIGCRNMDIGDGTPARYIECFEFFLAPTDADGENPRPELGADVINNSWTCPEEEGCTDPQVLRSAVEALRAAGIAQSFAAGNTGPACSSLSAVPPIYEAAFAVGATDLGDGLAIFSARGPVVRDGSNRIKPDLVAPGVGVRTSAPSPSADPYTIFGGTSGASPHVAGAIALLWSALPHLAGRVEETEELLEESAVPLTSGISCGGLSGGDVPNPFFGWGRLDVTAAFARATQRVTPALVDGTRPEARVLPPRP